MMNKISELSGSPSFLRIVKSLTLTSAFIELIVILYPINLGILRLALILLTGMILAGMTIIWRKNKILRWGPLLSLIVITSPFLLPGRPFSQAELQQSYIASLRSYEGVRYIWRGDNALGIDCSGLVRKALVVANFKEGIQHFNPTLLRQALILWWHRCSARKLSEGYDKRTTLSGSAKSLNILDSSRFAPGTMAVTKDGVHVMVYLGNGEWLEADPGLKKVIVLRPPTNNMWCEIPVNLVSWNQLTR